MLIQNWIKNIVDRNLEGASACCAPPPPHLDLPLIKGHLGEICICKDQKDIGKSGQGYPALLSADDKVVSILPRTCLQRKGITTRMGL